MGHGSAAIAMAGRSVRLLLLYFPLALLLAGFGTVGISLASTMAGMVTAEYVFTPLHCEGEAGPRLSARVESERGRWRAEA